MQWTPTSMRLPDGFERTMLLRVEWPKESFCGWGCFSGPEYVIGWWKHGPKCFSFMDIENANHLVTHWMDIQEPTEEK